MSNPLVTIVLPTLNGARYIRESLQSCLDQTYQNWEMIVVDGGSTDDTLGIVAAIDDDRIRVLHQPPHSGRLPGALNIGFADAQGRYFTWMQDDDLYAPDMLETFVNHLEVNPTIGFVYSAFYFIDERGNVIKPSTANEPTEMAQHNPIGHAFLYRRSVAKAIGDYAIDAYLAEDFEYWLRISKQFKMERLPGHYCWHRLHETSLTVSGYGGFRALRVASGVRRRLIPISRRSYYHQLSDSYLQEGFFAFQRSDRLHARRSMLQALRYRPSHILNRGVCAVIAKSLVGV